MRGWFVIEKSNRKQNYHKIEYIIGEAKAHGKFKPEVTPTAKEVLTYMIGDYDGWSNGDYVVYKYDDIKPKSFFQRLNTLWVYPLFIITIPIQYLITGSHGTNRNSKLGKIIDKLVGL